MKKKGEFLKQKEKYKNRQIMFDIIKNASDNKEIFFINIENIRYEIKPLSMLTGWCDDNVIIFEYVSYLVFHENMFKLAKYLKTNCWYIELIEEDCMTLKVGPKWLIKNSLGMVVKQCQIV